VLFALLALPAFAAERSDTLRPFLLAQTPSDQFESAETRASLIESALAYCRDVRSVFPRSSPAEKAWIDGEMNGSGDRMIRLLQTAEWGRLQAENFVDGCISFAELGKSQPWDVRAYIGLAFSFSKFRPYAEGAARQNGVDPDRFGFSYLGTKDLSFLRAALALLQSPSRMSK
jgi:hypothetical protein